MSLFADDFNRADAAVIGGSWFVNAGSFSIVSNQLKSGFTYSLARTTDLGASDMVTQLIYATRGTSSSSGVIARSDSAMNNFYMFRNDGTNWTLFRCNGGAFTAIGTQYAANAADGDLMALRVVGTTIEGYVNGVLRSSTTDSTITTGTYAGIRLASSSTSTYDNFAAYTTALQEESVYAEVLAAGTPAFVEESTYAEVLTATVSQLQESSAYLEVLVSTATVPNLPVWVPATTYPAASTGSVWLADVAAPSGPRPFIGWGVPVTTVIG